MVWGLGGASLGCCLTCLHLCLPAKVMGKDHDCSLPVEEAGIIWDSICFFFLLLQRRVFLSYYFLHVMLDLQASALQASRWGWGPGGVPVGAGVQGPPVTSPLSPQGGRAVQGQHPEEDALPPASREEVAGPAEAAVSGFWGAPGTPPHAAISTLAWMGVRWGGLGWAPQQPLPDRMERIRAKQEKYRQERLPRSSGEGQDETETGESWRVPTAFPPPLFGHSRVTVTRCRRLSW